MTAPADLTVTAHPGQLTHTVSPVDARGVRLNTTYTQPSATGNHSVGMSSSMPVLADVPVEDRSFYWNLSLVVPFNEANSVSEMEAKLRALAVFIEQTFIPSP